MLKDPSELPHYMLSGEDWIVSDYCPACQIIDLRGTSDYCRICDSPLKTRADAVIPRKYVQVRRANQDGEAAGGD